MATKKVSILLIEDDKLAQKMVVLVLKELNCEVQVASTCLLALECLQRQHFDLIFTDISLPDTDSFSLIKEIRAGATSNPTVPIVMLSAHSDKESIEQSFQAGATDFLVKPLNMELGQTILKKYLAT